MLSALQHRRLGLVELRSLEADGLSRRAQALQLGDVDGVLKDELDPAALVPKIGVWVALQKGAPVTPLPSASAMA